MYHFLPSLQTFDRLKFTFMGTWPNGIDIGFDSMVLQHGGVANPDDVLVTPGTFGSSSKTLVMNVNAQGRVTAISERAIVEGSDTVSLIAGEDFIYDTGLAVKPRIIQVFDATGVILGFERSFSTTYQIRIFATDVSQNAEVNIIY